MEPKVSIIIPCYNQAHYMPETLNSVLAQTYDNWECIILNDGATDNTEEVALEYCNRDSRFRYHKHENKGLSATRNVGIRLAEGQYLQFLDSDDILAPEKLQKQVSLLEDTGADVCTCHHDMFNNCDFAHRYTYSLSEAPHKFTVKDLGNTFIITPHDGLCRKSFIIDNEVFFKEDLRSYEDWLFWETLIVKGANFIEIDEILAHYRIHLDSMSKRNETMIYTCIESAFNLYALIPDKEKKEYIKFTSQRVAQIAKHFLRNYDAEKKANSIDYKFGAFLLYPFHVISRFLRKKGLRK